MFSEKQEQYMPYKVHRENRESVPGTHIIAETAPLFTVEMREEAIEAMRVLVEQGITDIYAVGYDWPPREQTSGRNVPFGSA
jgi:hypothetical protein